MPVTQFVKQALRGMRSQHAEQEKSGNRGENDQNCTRLGQILFEIVGLSFWLSVIDR